jgi:hypothetical protein
MEFYVQCEECNKKGTCDNYMIIGGCFFGEKATGMIINRVSIHHPLQEKTEVFSHWKSSSIFSYICLNCEEVAVRLWKICPSCKAEMVNGTEDFPERKSWHVNQNL